MVVADYERRELAFAEREGRSLIDLYSDYVQEKRGVAPSPELAEAFRSVADEVGAEL